MISDITWDKWLANWFGKRVDILVWFGVTSNQETALHTCGYTKFYSSASESVNCT